ncbi:MAG TPA: carbon-nitrogen hydrolase family protein [Xanthobacteraceae bacterium]|nr:carbon-nitrogen hydrolase family protein [Xanthobacteraceae bacterium]
MSKVAVVQTASVLSDRDRTVEKVVSLIREAAGEGAELILFPEALISGYPRGLAYGAVVGSRSADGRKLFQEYWDSAVEVPSASTVAIGNAARAAKAFVAVGVIERDSTFSGGSLYCTVLFFSPSGELVGKHRKLKPTGSERLIWSEGDGSTMPVFQTPAGRAGALICWENYMPLARMAMYAQGVQLLLMPTADARDIWLATIRHVAYEGRCFVLSCNQFVSKDMYPERWLKLPELADMQDVVTPGRSAIVNPMGEIIAGPLEGKEGILYADIDLDEIPRAKFDFDVTGHYSRSDVFQLVVNRRPTPAVTWIDGDSHTSETPSEAPSEPDGKA